MIYNFQSQGVHRIAQVIDPNTTTFWNQGCKNKELLGLTERETNHWSVYVEKLKKKNIRIIDEDDTLFLFKNHSMEFAILHQAIKQCS